MKIAVLVVCTCAILSVKSVNCAAIEAPLNVITLEDLSVQDRRHLEFLDKQFSRPKRSQSGDLLSILKSTIGQGIKSKIGLLAKGSGYLSSGSSGGHNYHHHHPQHHVPETHDHKSMDIWSLKKSIFNTLLQAVKAIKGGVIAIKGQLIKGSGYLVSAKGKLLSAKGEAITNVGKQIISSAQLIPHPSTVEHDDYGSYHHAGPSAEYGAPSAPEPEYQMPIQHHHSYPHGDKPEAGILIIKKIPDQDHKSSPSSSSSSGHDDKIPEFKPLHPDEPTFSTIVGKFLSASSSLNPDEPKPFGYASPGHDTLHESYSLLDNPNEYQSSHDASFPSNYERFPSNYERFPSSFVADHDDNGPPSTDNDEDSSPFEKAPSYLTEESKKSPVKEPPKLSNESTKVQHYDEIRPLHIATNQSPKPDEIRPLPTAFAAEITPVSAQISNYFSANLPPFETYPPYAENQNYFASFVQPEDTSLEPLKADSSGQNLNFGGFKGNFGGGISSVEYLTPPQSVYTKGLNAYRTHAEFASPSQYSPQKIRPYSRKRPVKHNRNRNKRRPNNVNVIKSLGYELRPDGPKRI